MQVACWFTKKDKELQLREATGQAVYLFCTCLLITIYTSGRMWSETYCLYNLDHCEEEAKPRQTPYNCQ